MINLIKIYYCSTIIMVINELTDINKPKKFTVGPADYDSSLTSVTLYGTTNSTATTELRIALTDESILEREEKFSLMLSSNTTRIIVIANSTSVNIINDDGECCPCKTHTG